MYEKKINYVLTNNSLVFMAVQTQRRVRCGVVRLCAKFIFLSFFNSSLRQIFFLPVSRISSQPHTVLDVQIHVCKLQYNFSLCRLCTIGISIFCRVIPPLCRQGSRCLDSTFRLSFLMYTK